MVTRPLVTLYTRQGCCLCEDVKEVLEAARARASLDYEEIDIDLDPETQCQYNDDVPVICINKVTAFKHRVELTEFLKKLKARQ